jgi:uncharacterized protein (DUF1697 family)
MAAFAKALEAAGCFSVRTVGASGNAIVQSPGTSSDAQLEQAIAAELARKARVETQVFVRDPREWRSVLEANPFRAEAADDPAHLVITVLRDSPARERWDELRRSVVGRERVAPGARCAYLVYPDGIGRSKLTALAIERALGTSGTSRNWNTARRLRELAEA